MCLDLSIERTRVGARQSLTLPEARYPQHGLAFAECPNHSEAFVNPSDTRVGGSLFIARTLEGDAAARQRKVTHSALDDTHGQAL